MSQTEIVYVLFKLKDGKLVIGTNESISMPKEFQDQSFEKQLKLLKTYCNVKNPIVVK
jgi:hypothetical protein